MSPHAHQRFYYAGQLAGRAPGDTIEMSPEESHHMLHVVRLQPGAQIDLFDAAGRAWSAEMVGADRLGRRDARAQVLLLGEIEPPALGRPTVCVAVALLKRRAMDFVIEKLSELGVATIQPVLAARSVTQAEVKANAAPPERWYRLAVAAAKQCGRPGPIELLSPMALEDWLERPHPPAHTIYAHPRTAAESIGQWFDAHASVEMPIWIVVGPEGGWDQGEEEAFERAGFEPVGLGPLILRAETAAVAAVAACRMH